MAVQSLQVLHSEFLPFPWKRKHMLLAALVFYSFCKKRGNWPNLMVEKFPGTQNPPRARKAQKETPGLDMLHLRLLISTDSAAAASWSYKNRAWLSFQIPADLWEDGHTTSKYQGGTLHQWDTS